MIEFHPYTIYDMQGKTIAILMRCGRCQSLVTNDGQYGHFSWHMTLGDTDD